MFYEAQGQTKEVDIGHAAWILYGSMVLARPRMWTTGGCVCRPIEQAQFNK